MKTLMEAEQLSIGYKGKELYSGLDLKLHRGTLTCLLGPNGVGKSTLLRSLTGLQKPLSGKVEYEGDSTVLENHRLRAKMFSVVLTDRIPMSYLSVEQVVALGRYPHSTWVGKLSDEDAHKIKWAMNVVGADKLAERKVHTLSDGERQRVMIARALAQQTPIVYLDEPTAFLDLPYRVEVMSILRELADECDITLLLSTHDMDLVLQFADQIWLLGKNGGFDAGTPEDLILNGHFERAFGGHRVGFDKMQGVFHSDKKMHTSVQLKGDAIGVRWTVNALKKRGIYGGSEKEPIVIDVQQIFEDTYEWKLTDLNGHYTFDSLHAAIEHLQGVPANKEAKVKA